jgi:CHAT domain-containing protein
MQTISKMLNEFIEAENWAYSLNVIQQYPELLGDAPSALLMQIIQEAEQEGDTERSKKLKYWQELLSRCREVNLEQVFYEQVIKTNNLPSIPTEYQAQVDEAQRASAYYLMQGDISFLNQSISIWDTLLKHSNFVASLSSFRLAVLRIAGEAYAQRYWVETRQEDIESTIALWNQILEQSAIGSVDHTQTASRMWSLSNRLRDLFRQSGKPWELDAAIQANEIVVNHTSSSTQLLYRLNRLGMSLIARYEKAGELRDLEIAIEVWNRALEYCLPNSSEAYLIMANLGSSLIRQYEYAGDVSNLERALTYLEDAKRNTPEDSPYLLSRSSNLSAAINEIYLRTGSNDELDKMINMCRQAVDREMPDSPRLGAYLNNLAMALSSRFSRKGNLVDLNNAILTCEQALQSTSLNDVMRSTVLNNYSEYLRRRFERQGRIDDINAAIDASINASRLTVTNPISQAAILNNIGNALSSRYYLIGEQADLDASIQAHEDALNLTPDKSPSMPVRQNNLSNMLRERASLTGSINELDRAVDLCKDAIDGTEQYSPQQVTLLDNLANALRERFTLVGASTDKEQATEKYAQAIRLGLELAIGEGLRSARNWGQWAFERKDWGEAAKAFAYAQEASELLFRVQLTRSDNESWLRETQGIADLTAYALAKNGQLQDAATILEQGRARLLAEVLERNWADLEKLQQMQPDLYNRYTQAAQRISSIKDEYNPKAQLIDNDYVAASEAIRLELDSVIKEIQSTPSFEEFLTSKSFDSIQASIQSLERSTSVVYLANTRAGSLALIIGADWMEAVWLDFDESDLQLLLKDYIPGIFSDDTDDADKAVEHILPILGKEIISSISECLRKHEATGVVLIPAGKLALLPLHAAQYSKDGGVTCLLDEFDVSYSPNVRVLDFAREEFNRRNNESYFVGIGNPLPHPNPLEGAEAELEKVAGFFQAERSETLYAEEATKQAVLNVIQRATLLHFACHGLFNAEDPLDSRLELASDEVLTLREIIYADARPEKARLIVMSACESGISDFRNLPDEFIGLPAGFLQAGVPGIVATLWAIADIATSLLMVRFYKNLLQGDDPNNREPMHPALALRQAQIWLRDVTAAELIAYYEAELRKPDSEQSISFGFDKEELDYLNELDPDSCPFDHPTYWAAFVFNGY